MQIINKNVSLVDLDGMNCSHTGVCAISQLGKTLTIGEVTFDIKGNLVAGEYKYFSEPVGDGNYNLFLSDVD